MLCDLSLRGAYVQTDSLPKEGDSMTLCFRVPGNDWLLRVQGVVVWVNHQQAHPVHSLPPGFGFSFLETSHRDLLLIARAIEAYCRSNPIYQQYV
jgi:hypothetical protein